MIDIENIPSSWCIERLGDFVISEKGKKPKNFSKTKSKEHPLPYVNIAAFEKNRIEEYTDGVGCVLCDDGDFLMVWDGSRSGYIGKAIKGALGSTLVKINFPGIENDYAYYFLLSKYLQINTRAKGTGTPHVDPDLLWNYQFPISPFKEQSRIVEKIEELFTELDKGIEQLEAVQQQLKVYRQAVLKWAFEGKLTNEKNIPVIPLSEAIEQPKYGTSKKCDYKIKGKGVLRIPNIGNGFIDVRDLKFAAFDKEEIETYSLRDGDILTIRSNGSVDLVGKCALITEKEKDFLFAGYLIRLRPIAEKAIPKYLLSVLSSHELRVQIETKAKSSSGVNNINSEELKALKIPLPNKKQQQRVLTEIESRLSVCDKIEETIENSLQQAEALRLSILKKAYEGKLVKQNPKDEPAQKLLERIRSLRQAQGKQKKNEQKKKSKLKMGKV